MTESTFSVCGGLSPETTKPQQTAPTATDQRTTNHRLSPADGNPLHLHSRGINSEIWRKTSNGSNEAAHLQNQGSTNQLKVCQDSGTDRVHHWEVHLMTYLSNPRPSPYLHTTGRNTPNTPEPVRQPLGPGGSTMAPRYYTCQNYPPQAQVPQSSTSQSEQPSCEQKSYKTRRFMKGLDASSHVIQNMLCSRRVVQQWCFAVFLLCSPAPHQGRPIDALSSRMRRSVSHAQLMHDKGRVLQDFKRRMWLQELLDEVHTAEIRDLQIRTGAAGGGVTVGSAGGGVGVTSSGAGGMVAGVPGVGIHLSTTGSTLHSKPAGGTKNLPLSFRREEEEEEEEGTNLPQETNKAQRTPGKKKKKGRGGRRREGEKRRRRARSLGWRPEEPQEEEETGSGLHLEWRSLLGLQRALL